ncbi:MAG: glycosyltransferase family 2 protein [Campylobacter sputorum]|uniref:glycosyltransferase family 2 protein n=1 Tax=Campylobacter sputorum TaxID=206 RepID=UPI000B78F943|nr:glycosyltransferase family 2 protein [Campylobacter sputorum]ASM37283.1 glycosyltransferase, family 2 [Campylobacter sputorum bv. faecalis CCUG 20703]ASM38947.1 glycosyltransferase, family 2 [Campylobacter sputorum bv. paraureolyticus LMG 11764]MDY6121190.1 glycosyltransferase family 2 protein [Campylobacter sputorum]
MKNYDISIIVPVYKAENFIEKCATTLFNQDYKNIEYIFVNDVTPDNSMEVLDGVINKFTNRKDDIKIINNEVNKGSSLTRKIGLDNSNGEYILFIDSDDWVELDMVSSLYKKAKEENADIVCCDYFVNFKKKEKYKKLQQNRLNSSLKYILNGGISPSLWDKLYKRELFFKVSFSKFSYAEDYFINIQFFYFAKKISYLNRGFLHYNQMNESSIVTNQNLLKRREEIKELFIEASKFLEANNLSNYKKYLYQYILILIITNSESNTKDNIYRISPDLYKIRYLWKNDTLFLLRKIIFSFGFFNMGFIVAYCKKLYKILQGKKR